MVPAQVLLSSQNGDSWRKNSLPRGHSVKADRKAGLIPICYVSYTANVDIQPCWASWFFSCSQESYVAPSLPVIPHPLTFPRHFAACWWQCRCDRLHARCRAGSFLQLKAGGGRHEVALAQCWGISDSQAAVPVFLGPTGNEISFLSVSPVTAVTPPGSVWSIVYLRHQADTLMYVCSLKNKRVTLLLSL